MSIEYRNSSEKIVGKEKYGEIFLNANDSIKTWKNARLKAYIENKNETKTMLDSLLCFNTKGDKFISAMLGQVLIEESESDGIYFFYGVKVKEQWYFFDGASVFLPRDYYQKDIHTPLSFEKLHEIAMKEVYGGYLNGGKINEHFFERIPNKNMNAPGYGGCFECKTEDEYYLHLVKRNWTKRDTSVAKQDSLKM